MKLPRISVVTPSFNQGRFLDASIRSVLEQGYEDLEYIVMDGGSQDDSAEIIRRHAPRLAYWQSARDGGQAAAIAAGFRRATGEILCWLNSDDLLLPGALDTVGRFFARAPDTGLVYGSRQVIDEDGRRIGTYRPPSLLHKYYFAFGQWIPQECAFWRRALFDRAGGLDESMFFAMDLSLFVRMWSLGRFRRVPEELGAIRMHAETKTSKHAAVMMAEAERIRRANGIPHFRSRIVNRIAEELIRGQAQLEQRLEARFAKAFAARGADSGR